MKLVIKNISELVQVEKSTRKWVAGSDMQNLHTIKDAFIEINEGVITNFGSIDDWAGIDDWNNTEIIDASSGIKITFVPLLLEQRQQILSPFLRYLTTLTLTLVMDISKFFLCNHI